MRIAGGQEKLSGKVIRVGHMGAIRERDLAMVVGALERTLAVLGRDVKAGTGLSALQSVLFDGLESAE